MSPGREAYAGLLSAVRNRMDTRGLTVEGLADRAGLTASRPGAILNRTGAMDIEELLHIATALDVSPAVLVRAGESIQAGGDSGE